MVIQSENVYLGSSFQPAQIEIEEKRIIAIHEYNTKEVDIDYGNKRIVPGFYDIHTHGYLGYDATTGEKEGLITWKEALPKEGVCGFCPTTITASSSQLTRAFRHIAEIMHDNEAGAEILGIHMEGPYISKEYKGAHNDQFIKKGTIEEFESFQQAAQGMIRIVTIAPEEDNQFELIKYLVKNGVCVSLGHSAATYEIAKKAIRNGASCFTHTYNAMRAFHHREAGMVGAALNIENAYAEIIGDGIHTSFEALSIFYKLKKDYAIMVSDALSCKGYPIGTSFLFMGQEAIIYPDGSAHLQIKEKPLAGSTLKMNEGLYNIVEKARVPFSIALASITNNPCKYLGIDQDRGSLEQGKNADIVILDEDYSIIQTYCCGKKQL
ncbi:MAG: N-acetylglucosamine-6-phosphate deacetylase [Solobacterium sp.]|nr:N-acetylglucosamine-6-phosphate deacetylase [Solobacterium sp.]